MKRLLLTTALVLAAIAAHADGGVPARKLYESCSTKYVEYKGTENFSKLTPAQKEPYFWNRMAQLESKAELDACHMFLRGFVDALDVQNAVSPAGSQSICVPTGVSAADLRDIFVESFRANPKKRHLSAGTFAAGALLAAFPCEGSERKS